MKSILLTTTALVAFAGAAAADGHTGVSFSGGATLGYNDNTTGDNDGFYWSADADVTMSAALDNGVTASATWGFDIVEDDAFDSGADFDADDFLITIKSEMAALYFGDTDPSADLHWSGVDGDTVGDFRGITEHDGPFEAILRGEATMSGVTASISYGVDYDNLTSSALGGLQVAAVADVSGFTVVGAYEAEDTNYGLDSQFGVSVAGAVAGVDVKVAYSAAETDNVSSLGLSASMPFGPVTVGGYYSLNSGDTLAAENDKYGLDVSYSDGPISISADFDTDADDTTDATWEVDGSYDTGMNVVVYAGLNSDEEYYVAGTYDLGGGAELLVSYAAGLEDDDEVGAGDYQEGTTVEVSFSF